VHSSHSRFARRAFARLSLVAILPVLLPLSCAPVEAQITANPANATTLPDIVVTATSSATPAAEIGNSVTVITPTRSPRNSEHRAGLLTDVPGLNVVQTGGPGGRPRCSSAYELEPSQSTHDGIDASDPSNPNGSSTSDSC